MDGIGIIKIFLSEEEIQVSAIVDLCDKVLEWKRLSKNPARGRKTTRSTNKRVDQLYEEILNTEPPKIILKDIAPIPISRSSSKSSVEGDSSGIESSAASQCGRTLRPRSRTPSLTRNQSKATMPSTPTQQSLRAHLKRNLDSNNSNVLSAAINQQHPTVSATKIRQLLRADSAQKRRDEEKERHERLIKERKAKDERADQQKKQILEERAINAKKKREERLQHAAELRKAREIAKQEQARRQQQIDPVPEPEQSIPVPPPAVSLKYKTKTQPEPVAKTLNQTFQNENDNIEISIADDTQDEKNRAGKIEVAAWAKMPYLREAIVSQYSKPGDDINKLAFDIFHGVKMPVELDNIFGPSSINNKHYHRSSSAVWSSPYRGIKRSSSMVLTPTDPKR